MKKFQKTLITMKRNIILITLMILTSILTLPLQGQEKGHFLTVKGGLGATGLQYDLLGPYKDGDRFNKLGWNAEIGYQYFFHKHWGIATGIGISYYRTLGTYPDAYRTNNYFNLGNQIDDDPLGRNDGKYEMRVHLTNWHEMQKTYFIEVPLMLLYQHKFGAKKTSGFFVGAGFKALLPVSSKFNVMDAKDGDDKRLWITGYYDDGHLTLGGEGDPDLSDVHGMGSIYNPYEKLGWKGEAPVKMSLALSGEAGFLIGLSSRVELILSAYVDYGLTNMKANASTLKEAYKNTFKKANVSDCPELLEAPESYLPDAGGDGNFGKGITYNGMVMSNRTDRINSLAFGGKIGLRIKLGKVAAEPTITPVDVPNVVDKKAQEKMQRTLDSLRRRTDVLNQKLDKLLAQEKEPQPIIEIPEPETKVTFRGVVTDEVTNDPISAVVQVLDDNDNVLGVQLSDPNTGAFEITDIPKGISCHIVAKNANYVPKTLDNIMSPDDGSTTASFNIEMTKLAKGSRFVVKNVFFDTDKYILKPESIREINNIYKIMQEYPNMKVEISGHTDIVGTHAHNMTLSRNRAAAVVQALIDKGIHPSRIKSAGYGPDVPIATNETPEGRAENRRVEFKILDL